MPALVSSVARRAVCANCPEKLQSAGDIEINDTLAAVSGRETQISFVSLFCFFAVCKLYFLVGNIAQSTLGIHLTRSP